MILGNNIAKCLSVVVIQDMLLNKIQTNLRQQYFNNDYLILITNNNKDNFKLDLKFNIHPYSLFEFLIIRWW